MNNIIVTNGFIAVTNNDLKCFECGKVFKINDYCTDFIFGQRIFSVYGDCLDKFTQEELIKCLIKHKR